MPKLFLLFSHTLTEEQLADARRSLQITECLALPPDLQARWSNVPPDLPQIAPHLQPIIHWLQQEAHPGDYVLIQGDFGAIYLLVQAAWDQGLTPIYATTRRQVIETPLPDGRIQVQRVFQHVRYRVYERLSGP
jgi:hypothetical protein